MKPETIIDILESYLDIDKDSAEQIYYELPEGYFDSILHKVPLGLFEEHIEIIEQIDFFDRFGSIQEYKEFKDSCVQTPVIELDNGSIVILNF